MKMCSKVDQTATLSPQDNYFPEVLENCKEICYNVENAKAKWRKPDEEVRIMAVTKTVPPEKVNFAVAQGFKLLGENRVQEFLSKKEAYDKSAEVQFIGHIIRRFSSALDLKAVHACLCKLINVVEHTHILGVEDISSFFVLKNRIKLIGALFFHKVVSPAARLCALATICVTVYKVLGKQTSA